LIEQAIQIIAETRKASATLLQRKLGIGFARAARIMDALEEKGVI
jgi:S-DNA-T family DNA segregation ATPase FtsK/SpoIIIE